MSKALTLAMFSLIQREVEASEDDTAKTMFIEIFTIKNVFFERFIKEIERSDEIEAV